MVRDNKKFEADVKLDSLQRIIYEEKLAAHNSDYAKCCRASMYFRDMLDPLVTKCPICGNTIA